MSFDAATLLARIPPWRLEPALRYRVYSRIIDLKARNEFSPQTEKDVRNGENLLLVRQWEISLSKPGIWGQKTVEAIRPSLRKWLVRDFGEVNYYLAQMLTGHGSFGHFLCRIDKRETAACFHCSSEDDTLEHTVAQCPAWNGQRLELIHKLGIAGTDRLTLSLIVRKKLEKKEFWQHFSRFAVSVVKMKEEVERRRERIFLSFSLNSGTSIG